jgi:hypothetical protein
MWLVHVTVVQAHHEPWSCSWSGETIDEQEEAEAAAHESSKHTAGIHNEWARITTRFAEEKGHLRMVGCRLLRLALGGSRLAARRGFYIHDPELGGSAWIELQNGSRDRWQSSRRSKSQNPYAVIVRLLRSIAICKNQKAKRFLYILSKSNKGRRGKS